MALSAGTRVGVHEMVALLAAGGILLDGLTKAGHER